MVDSAFVSGHKYADRARKAAPSMMIGSRMPEVEPAKQSQIDAAAEQARFLISLGGHDVDGARAKLQLTHTPEWLIDAGIAQYLASIEHVVGPGISDKGSHYPWDPTAIDRATYWPPVRERLTARIGEQAVASVDAVTDRILYRLEPPTRPEFSTRGLVLGYVQSGKTTNFISLAAKAADHGYRLIIVLSGMTDILRDQTQGRVDDVLIAGSEQWHALTTADSDFRVTEPAGAALSHLPAMVAVVKKNPGRLRRLRDWLKTAPVHVLRQAPMLIVDDEADQASIDVGGNGRQSTINSLLRELLEHPKSAYVAYTATPFANLLIDPSDPNGLYPRNFVEAMPEPTDYFGSARLFGSYDDPQSDGLDVARRISDEEAGGARPPRGAGALATWTPSIGPALADAIRWFIVATAARRCRHDLRHSSMLVHTSMLSHAHFRTRDAVDEFVAELRDRIHAGDCVALGKLRALYEAETATLPATTFGHSAAPWAEVQARLMDVADAVELVVDNYLSSDRLVYEEAPRTVIAIGGNTLSRGLTLEGLVSSYFVRSASAYDTLLQMGRWFGYRQGYEDLQRIWMTDELARWFRDLSFVEQEIREDIGRYASEGLTPLELAIRIRQHPNLAITAAAKMRDAVQLEASFSGKSPQTTTLFRTDTEILQSNFDAVLDLLSTASGEAHLRHDSPGTIILDDVSVHDVRKLIESFTFHPAQQELTAANLLGYIDGEVAEGELLEWRIVVMRGDGDPLDLPGGLGSIKRNVRSRLRGEDDSLANIKALMSQGDRLKGLGHDDAVDTSEMDPASARSALYHGGILRVYFIDSRSAPKERSPRRVPFDASGPVVGLAFDFPFSLRADASFTYVVAPLPGDTEELADAEVAQADALDESNADG